VKQYVQMVFLSHFFIFSSLIEASMACLVFSDMRVSDGPAFTVIT